MIGMLTGIIREKTPPFLLLDVNGVSYELQAPMTTFYQLPEINEKISLYTHLSIREDAHQLYGFFHKRDRDLFRALIKINGVGPKLGLSILSGIEPQQFVYAIQSQDASSLIKIPGVGKKTAERLMIECRDALKKWQPINTETQQQPILNSATEDAIDALTTLGYRPNEAKRTVDKVYKAGLKAEELIRHALAHMIKGVH